MPVLPACNDDQDAGAHLEDAIGDTVDLGAGRAHHEQGGRSGRAAPTGQREVVGRVGIGWWEPGTHGELPDSRLSALAIALWSAKRPLVRTMRGRPAHATVPPWPTS